VNALLALPEYALLTQPVPRLCSAPKLQLPNMVLPDANLAIVQLTFRLPGSFDVVFLSNPHHKAPARLQQLTGTHLPSPPSPLPPHAFKPVSDCVAWCLRHL
jgi:hypothetical protein